MYIFQTHRWLTVNSCAIIFVFVGAKRKQANLLSVRIFVTPTAHIFRSIWPPIFCRSVVNIFSTIIPYSLKKIKNWAFHLVLMFCAKTYEMSIYLMRTDFRAFVYKVYCACAKINTICIQKTHLKVRILPFSFQVISSKFKLPRKYARNTFLLILHAKLIWAKISSNMVLFLKG